jgi:O-antigen ligase
MSSHTDVGQPGNISTAGLFPRTTIWIALGWGLCAVVLLGFSPRLFHIQEYFFFSLLGLAILLCILERKSLWISTSLYTPFLCFVGWIALTIPFSIDPWISLNEWQKVVAQLAVFYGTCLIVQEQREDYFQRRILPVLFLGAIACYTYSLIDFWERGGNLWDRTIRAGFPTFDRADFTWLSTNVLMVLPVLITGLIAITSAGKRLALVCGIILSLLALIFSYSRGVWLAFLTQILIGSFLVNKRQAFQLLGVTIAALLALGVVLGQLGLHRETFDSWTIKARLTVWNLSASDLLEHPIVGVGYGVPILEKRHGQHIVELEAVNPGIPDIPEKPHNWYLMVTTGTGLPGLAFFLWLLAKVGTSVYEEFTKARTSSRRWLQMGIFLMVVGFSIRIFFDDSFGGSHSYLFWLLVGMSTVISKPRAGGGKLVV